MSAASPSEYVAAHKPRALITGVHGFTGRHLRTLLESKGFEVHGAVLTGHALSSNEHAVDLLDFGELCRVVEHVQPRFVVHLAAVSFVQHDDVDAIYRTNILASRNLLRALAAQHARQSLRTVLVASSANVYGNTPLDPIAETAPFRPANDYAVSKVAMEHMAALWSEQLPLTLVRPFNYTGVGQSSVFLVPKIVEAFRQRAPKIELGNLDVERDFCDVRDVATAYLALLEASPRGVFNICSGKTTSLAAVLEMAAFISGHELEVEVNPAFVRANEVKRLRGSDERLRSVVPSWNPRPVRETIEWMLTDETGAPQ